MAREPLAVEIDVSELADLRRTLAIAEHGLTTTQKDEALWRAAVPIVRMARKAGFAFRDVTGRLRRTIKRYRIRKRGRRRHANVHMGGRGTGAAYGWLVEYGRFGHRDNPPAPLRRAARAVIRNGQFAAAVGRYLATQGVRDAFRIAARRTGIAVR